jgi:hypothetical protein
MIPARVIARTLRRVFCARSDGGDFVPSLTGLTLGDIPHLPRELVATPIPGVTSACLRPCDTRPGAAELVVQRGDGSCLVIPLSPRMVRIWNHKLATIIARVK